MRRAPRRFHTCTPCPARAPASTTTQLPSLLQVCLWWCPGAVHCARWVLRPWNLACEAHISAWLHRGAYLASSEPCVLSSVIRPNLVDIFRVVSSQQRPSIALCGSYFGGKPASQSARHSGPRGSGWPALGFQFSIFVNFFMMIRCPSAIAIVLRFACLSPSIHASCDFVLGRIRAASRYRWVL